MIALSIRQQWAWLIVRPDLSGEARTAAIKDGVLKDIENRTWPTRFRGRFYIHAAKGMTRAEYEDCQDPLWSIGGPTIELPPFEDLERGGIVGTATLVDCVAPQHRESWWHMSSQFGFKLADVEPLPFYPYKGSLGFFTVNQ